MYFNTKSYLKNNRNHTAKHISRGKPDFKIDIDTPYFACFHRPFLATKKFYIYIYIYFFFFKQGNNYFLKYFSF